jgi:hypothetical protein
MTRYIIISKNTGYIIGDSAAYAEGQKIDGPMEAVRLLDKQFGFKNIKHIEYGPRETAHSFRKGYYVYSADTDEIPIIVDGKDQEQIAAVDRKAKLEAFIEREFDYGWD